MDNWMILAKFSILVYCIFKYTIGETSNIVLVILSLLIYICLTMFYYIVKNKWLKCTLLLMSTVLLFISSIYLDPLFILQVPFNIIELAAGFKIKLFLPISLIALISLIVQGKDLPEYILTALFCCQLYLMTNTIYLRMERISQENDVLREKSNILSGRLSRGFEYENQLKHLSTLEERNKIAQEIHDRLGHTISGSLMLLEAAKLISESDREKAGLMLQNAIDKLRDGMESIRAALRNIKPPLEQMSINRVKFLLDEFSVNSQIKTNIAYKGEISVISYTYWKLISENIKEALTNSQKYAKSTVISVNIEVLNKYVKAEVRDNGVGAVKIVKGLGISGIEERCAMSGGKVIIDSSNGFSIIMLLPLEEGNNAD